MAAGGGYPRSMARALTAVFAALALLVGGLGLAVYLTRDEDNIQVDNILSENFTRAVGLAEQNRRDVDLRRLAGSDWDHVLIVEPGTSRAEISRRLGQEWTGTLGFQSGDLLLLLRDGKVKRFFDYRGEGRFDGLERPFAELPRARAVFRVRDLVITPKE
jgi:hypothetical protein